VAGRLDPDFTAEADGCAEDLQSTQKAGGYHENDARWTHASVYLGMGFSSCEATKKGVHHASLLDSMATHLVRVRRDPRLDPDTRWKIAVSASLQIGTKYGFWSAAKIYWRSRGGLHVPQTSATQSGASLICSELYADAYLSATGRTLVFQHVGKASPAFLSFAPELRDVPMNWRKIPDR
jgi:hypothetical protein